MLSEGFWYGGFSVVVPEDFFRPGVFFFFFLWRRAVEVDDENLRIRAQIDILIVRQIADARHVFARFVDVRLAKLFVECGNLVVGMRMVVADLFGRLRQGCRRADW